MKFLGMFRRWLALLSVLGLATVVLAGCAKDNQPLLKLTCSGISTEHIVIMGSSSAAGAGAEGYEYSWAGLLSANSKVEQVSNIAIGGLVSYQLLPVSFEVPAGRENYLPNANANVELAASLHPSLVVISLPSNDQTVGFSASEVQANFSHIANYLSGRDIPVLFVGLQPRSVQLTARLQADDAALGELFGECWLPVFDQLASESGTLAQKYDYDGVHLNRDGHQVIYKTLVERLFEMGG